MIKLDFKPRRTSEGYRFTTDDVNGPEVKALKAQIAAHNRHVREYSREYGRKIGKLQRVYIMPRGPRVVPARLDGLRYRAAYYSYLPQRHGTHFDIYAGEDSSNQYYLNREIDTGMTPGQLRRHDNLQAQMRRLEMDARLQKQSRERNAQ